jgi:hypothetical protein
MWLHEQVQTTIFNHREVARGRCSIVRRQQSDAHGSVISQQLPQRRQRLKGLFQRIWHRVTGDM